MYSPRFFLFSTVKLMINKTNIQTSDNSVDDRKCPAVRLQLKYIDNVCCSFGCKHILACFLAMPVFVSPITRWTGVN